MAVLNAKTGKRRDEWKKVMQGCHWIVTINENCKMLDLFQKNKLVARGALFHHKDIHKVNHISSN